MRAFFRFIDITLYLLIAVLLISVIGSTIVKKPILMSVVRSNSMYPEFKRGDIIFLSPIWNKNSIKVGNVAMFKADEGNLASMGWIVHRIVGGNGKDGFLTKGDANDRADQESDGTNLIKTEQVAGSAVTIGNFIPKVPLIGYIPLWLEEFRKNQYFLPAVFLLLILILTMASFKKRGKKKKREKSALNTPSTYFFTGMLIFLISGASMLSASYHMDMIYEVSKESQGAIVGSDMGILKIGETVERPLYELKNNSILPIIATITSSDVQMTFSQDIINVKPHQEVKTTMKVIALNPGNYKSTIHIGKFLPLLPAKVIYKMAKMSYWVALIAVSSVPALPILIYPFVDFRLRRRVLKEIRSRSRKVRNVLPGSYY